MKVPVAIAWLLAAVTIITIVPNAVAATLAGTRDRTLQPATMAVRLRRSAA